MASDKNTLATPATPAAQTAPTTRTGRRGRRGTGAGARNRRPRNTAGSIALGVIAETLIAVAVVLALYVVWQLWWTGVDADRAQTERRDAVSWSAPASDPANGNYKIAQPQEGDPPVQPAADSNPAEGTVIADVYIPRFGSQWKRTVFQGTESQELAMGMGHYPTSQMPGALGNFAFAGHRAGYGEPLAYVDKLVQGDAIVIRTQDFWYVYQYTQSELVTPDQVEVIDPVPHQPAATPTQRLITMTTCHPRYQNPTHRWISYGQLKYWARVSDGIPTELASQQANGTVAFTQEQATPISRRIPPLTTMLIWAALAFVIVFIAAAIVWRWPALAPDRRGRGGAGPVSWLSHLMPGALPVRILLMALLAFMAAAALFQWTFPWAAANIPYLQITSNYANVTSVG